MTVGAFAGVADRMIREFPDDPVLLRHVVNAQDLPPIVSALAESFVAATEANVSIRSGGPVSGSMFGKTCEHAAEKREAVLLELMQFFELREVRGHDIVVRRSGDAGLSIRYRKDATQAGHEA